MKAKIDQFSYAFPTLIRYTGLITTLVLIGFCLAGFYIQAAPGFAATAAMILYKNLDSAARYIEKEEATTDGK